MILPIPTVGDLPERAHPGDAGADLRLATDVTVTPGTITAADTTTAVAIPDGYVGVIALRSSLGRRGLIIPNGVGVIDAGYSGVLGLTLATLGAPIRLDAGERVAQLIILPLPRIIFRTVDQLPRTPRSDGAFGSTGRYAHPTRKETTR